MSLIGFWKAEDNANDSSGFGRNGSWTGTPTYVAGKSGKAFSISTVGPRYITVPATGLELGTGDFSVVFWVNPTTLNDSARQMVAKCVTDATGFITLAETTRTRVLMGNGTWNRVVDGGVLPTSVWTMISCVKTASETSLYFNRAVFQASGSGACTFPNTDPLEIGVWGFLNQYFNGYIDEVRLYNNALSVADIQSIYDSYPDTVPEIELSTITQRCDETVKIHYLGIDSSSSFCSLTANDSTPGYKFAIDPYTTWSVMTPDPLDSEHSGIYSLGFTPVGSSLSFIWNLYADFDDKFDGNVKIKLQAFDGATYSAAATSSAFPVFSHYPMLCLSDGDPVRDTDLIGDLTNNELKQLRDAVGIDGETLTANDGQLQDILSTVNAIRGTTNLIANTVSWIKENLDLEIDTITADVSYIKSHMATSVSMGDAIDHLNTITNDIDLIGTTVSWIKTNIDLELDTVTADVSYIKSHMATSVSIGDTLDHLNTLTNDIDLIGTTVSWIKTNLDLEIDTITADVTYIKNNMALDATVLKLTSTSDGVSVENILKRLLSMATGKIVKVGDAYEFYAQDNLTKLFTLTDNSTSRTRS